MSINVQLHEDPRKLALLDRIADATEAIAATLAASAGSGDQEMLATVAAFTERLKKSREALAAKVEANPVPAS